MLVLPYLISAVLATPGLSFGGNKLSSVDLQKRDNVNGTVLVQLTNDPDEGLYSLTLELGSDQQEITLQLDTGSSDMWVFGSSICESTSGLSQFGCFNESSSSSFQSNNTELVAEYGSGSANGTYGQDTVKISGIEVHNVNFGVVNQSAENSMGILGVSLQGQEFTTLGFDPAENYTYANFPAQLVQQGFTNRNVYSLFLNSTNSTSGSILFGGVDHAKYEGSLQIVPSISTVAFAITLSNISTITADGDEIQLNIDQNYVILDSGTSNCVLPTEVIDAIGTSFGFKRSSDGSYHTTRSSEDNVSNGTINFNFQGIEIAVPLEDFLTEGEKSDWVLNITPSDEFGTNLLGDIFLSSAYVVYDLDKFEIALAPAIFTADEEIEAIVDDIPEAVSVSDWDSTWEASEATATATSTGSTGTEGTESSEGSAAPAHAVGIMGLLAAFLLVA